MAVTPITVYSAPFQGGEASTPSRAFGTSVNLLGATPLAGIAQVATDEMSFVNDGYTILFVTSGAEQPQLTITAVSDNAGRAVNIGPTALTINDVRAFGPFRPVWWNFGGVVNLFFTSPPVITNVKVAAVSFQF